MARSSHSYHHHYHHNTNDDIGFVFTVIVAAAAYRYWQGFVGLEHQVGKMLPIIGTVIVATTLLVLFAKFKLHNRSAKLNRSMAEIDSMSGLDFEKYIAALLKQKGYIKIKLTEKFDYGVDIIAHKDGIRWGIQTKRYSGLCKKSAVEQVIAGLKYYHCTRAMVITNSTFSKQAKVLANANDCILVDRNELQTRI
jgi:restriction system protein